MPTTPSFGTWLKQRRKALDLTQERLAAQVGCASETLRKIEAGRRPSRELAERLADALALPPTERDPFLHAARPIRLPVPAQPAAAPPRNEDHLDLPLPLTPLIGRTQEVASVCACLARASLHLLTLVGPPGIGKTRLAVADEASADRRHVLQDADEAVVAQVAPTESLRI